MLYADNVNDQQRKLAPVITAKAPDLEGGHD